MTDVCVYFQVHQPYRLRAYRVFDIGSSTSYFDTLENRRILSRVAARCYRRANGLLERLICDSGGIRVAMSLSGVLLEQLEADESETLDTFRSLIATGGVELLGETSHHSLAALVDEREFRAQVALHADIIERLFQRRAHVFRNTELIFFDALAPIVQQLGFRGVMVEGASHVLEWRGPTYVYESSAAPGLRLLARHYRLSDDIAFRFSQRDWSEWPLRAERFAEWLAATPGDCVNLYMDYETFGEHQWAETGIFEFLSRLPAECEARGVRFVSPSELVSRAPVDQLSFPTPTSWADQERDMSAWLGNPMQRAAHERLYALARPVERSGRGDLFERWRRLSTSDHFYYMATKDHSDGDVHAYFNPYASPYDAFSRFMTVLQDLEQTVAGSLDGGR